LHSSGFRRLAGKTQVFIFPDDHQRTRLTHALEVAQVATAIARSLRLNVALVEAIALGHDCGHGPGGHASEEAFSPYVEGGFDHAVFGADVTLAPLNLTVEVLDGVRNHSWSRPSPLTPEGVVVSWADRIAYVCHDFEDALHAGVVDAVDLPDVVRRRCGSTRSAQLNHFVSGVLEGTRLAAGVAMPTELAEALAAFRAFNYERIYLRPASRAQGSAVVGVLRFLVERFGAKPELLPEGRDAGLEPNTAEAYRRSVAYVGGMTDRFACDMALHCGWPVERLPSGFDLSPKPGV
jgi:dGTPase